MESNKQSQNKVRPQNKHLIPCKPGETANPNGRPKGQRNYITIWNEAVKQMAEKEKITPEQWEENFMKLPHKFAKKGDYRWYKDVLDRKHGQAPQVIDMTVKGLETMSDEELAQLKKKQLARFNKTD